MSGIALAEWTPRMGEAADTPIGVATPNGFLRARVGPGYRGPVRRHVADRATAPALTPDAIADELADLDGLAEEGCTDVLPVCSEADPDEVATPASDADEAPRLELDRLTIDVSVDVQAWMVGPDGALKPNTAVCRRIRREMFVLYQASRASGVTVRWLVAGRRAAEAIQALVDDGLYGDQIGIVEAPEDE